MLIFDRWYGRFGNNTHQLKNAIQMCMFLKCKIQFTCKPHKYFDIRIIEKYFSSNGDIGRTIQTPDSFYRINQFPKEARTQNVAEAVELLKQAFQYNGVKQMYSDDDIVIHIRSGDIFKLTPHLYYTPPPLCYYTHIINSNTYNRIILIAEDNKNPVIDKLLQLYPNIEYKQQTLDEDIKTILGSSHIVCSIGSFIPALHLLSENITKIYNPGQFSSQLSQYHQKNKPWKNTEEQKKLMLEYKYP